VTMSGPIAWDDRREQADLPFHLRNVPLTRRLGQRTFGARVRSAQRAAARSGRCDHHDRDDLEALWAEPNGTNPTVLIGHFCRGCSTIFTPAGTPSAAEVPTKPKIPGSPLRPSAIHAARVRAVDRLGVAYDARRDAA